MLTYIADGVDSTGLLLQALRSIDVCCLALSVCRDYCIYVRRWLCTFIASKESSSNRL